MENVIKELEQKLLSKEQECETLASQLDFEVQKKECLEQECEEFKNTVMKKCPQCGEVYLNPIGCELYEQINQLKSDNKHLNGLLDQALKELEEHREILEKVRDYCNKYPQNSIGFKQQILQICDEVNKDEYDDLSGHWLFDKE